MTEVILVADDDPDLARVMEVNLKIEGYEVVLAADGREALRRAEQVHPDLVLLDVVMPAMDGVEVARRLRGNPHTAETVIILLTVLDKATDKAVGFDVGADDYLTKPCDPIELLARVRRALKRAREMRSLSPLTGLPGNVQIQERLDALVGAGRPFALLYCDLDHFKAYNDTKGFVQGDELLRATASVIEDVVLEGAGSEGFVGHIGGDDFVALVPPEGAEEMAESIVARFEERILDFYEPGDLKRSYVEIEDRRGQRQRIPLVSLSIGIATTARRSFHHYAEAVAVATEMKNYAKRQAGSSYGVDRRGDS